MTEKIKKELLEKAMYFYAGGALGGLVMYLVFKYNLGN